MGPAFGSVTITGYRVDDTAAYSCASGYRLDGDEVRTCLQTGMWSGSDPTCEGTVIIFFYK